MSILTDTAESEDLTEVCVSLMICYQRFELQLIKSQNTKTDF